MNSTDVTDAQLPRGAGTADNEVRPSPAASILLLRGEPYEVLLMRRSDRSTFAPGAWVFPGGTLEEQDVSLARRFGEGENELLSMKVCAIREVFEETGLRVDVDNFMFGCEFLHHPLHSVELFFAVSILDGNLGRGSDPELQIIRDVRFFTPGEIRALKPEEVHGIFRKAVTPEEFRKLGGFYRI